MDQSLHTPAAERRRLEQESLKASRIQHIVECCLELFAEKGIEDISMNEIAAKAEIGVASLYRYFVTKEELAIEVAIYAWTKEDKMFCNVYSSADYEKLSGYGQLEKILRIFPDATKTEVNFFRFLYYFDSFVKREKISPERLKKYEETISVLNVIVINAMEKGKKDGSVKMMDGATIEEMYFTVMHSILSLAEKLALSGEMLYMDKAVHAEKQMELLVNIMLASVKA